MVGGATVSNVRDYVDIKLSDSTAAELAKRPVEYDSSFTLLPGRYSMKFLARDDVTGRIGTYQTEFVIPNLNKVMPRLPISSVVLSSQRVDLKDALYNTTKGKQQAKDDANNPLVESGFKLIPSVTRVFNTGREMYVYLQAYAGGNPSATSTPAPASPKAGSPATAPAPKPTPPLVAMVSFYRDQGKAYTEGPIAATPLAASRLGLVPLSFHIPLSQLAPGQYECQVTVLDPSGNRAAFWVNPVLLVR
jgi:hypothetical protein